MRAFERLTNSGSAADLLLAFGKFCFFLQPWLSIYHMPDSRLDARNSRTYKTPDPGPSGSHSQLGPGTDLQSTLKRSAQCHDIERCGKLQEPTGESLDPQKAGNRGTFRKHFWRSCG